MNQIELYCDGGSRGNPGPCAAGFVIQIVNINATKKESDQGGLFEEDYRGESKLLGGEFLGIGTNNKAEWKSLILGLEKVLATFGPKTKVSVFMDSELVVKQVKGVYRVKHQDLIPFHDQYKILSQQFQTIKVNHVYRENNREADQVVNQILDQYSLLN